MGGPSEFPTQSVLEAFATPDALEGLGLESEGLLKGHVSVRNGTAQENSVLRHGGTPGGGNPQIGL